MVHLFICIENTTGLRQFMAVDQVPAAMVSEDNLSFWVSGGEMPFKVYTTDPETIRLNEEMPPFMKLYLYKRAEMTLLNRAEVTAEETEKIAFEISRLLQVRAKTHLAPDGEMDSQLVYA